MYGSLPPPPFQCWLWERTESDHLKTWVSRLGIFPFSSLRSADNEELSSKSLWVRPFLFLGHAQTPRLASQLWKVLSTVWQAAQYLSSLQRNADCKISLLIHILRNLGGIQIAWQVARRHTPGSSRELLCGTTAETFHPGSKWSWGKYCWFCFFLRHYQSSTMDSCH